MEQNIEYPANRVVQLDSRSLDKNLIKSFQAQLDNVFESLLLNNSKFQMYYNKFNKNLSAFYYLTQLFSGIIQK